MRRGCLKLRAENKVLITVESGEYGQEAMTISRQLINSICEQDAFFALAVVGKLFKIDEFSPR